MSVALLDVNILLGLFWENHVFHGRISEWFASAENHAWATCPITEQGFVRIVSNVTYMKPAPGVQAALELLQQATEASNNHEFWADDLPLSALSEPLKQRLRGHKQITDAYLLALAIHRKGKLVTFDPRMRTLAPEGSAEADALVILRS